MSLAGKCLCFTGALTLKRSDADALATSKGATIASSLTKAVDILVAGPGAGSKLAKAAASGVTVWTEAQFMESVKKSQAVSPLKAAPKPASKKSPAVKKTAAKKPAAKKPAPKKGQASKAGKKKKASGKK